jgi:CRP-like cAMP-binding protein
MTMESVEWFRGLTDEQTAAVNRIAEAVDFAAGATVFDVGDPSDAFYLLESGEMQVEVLLPETDDVISVLQPVTIFGEVGLLDEEQRSATVRAVTDCRTRRIRNSDFLSLLATDAELAARFWRNLARTLFQRLSDTTENLVFQKIGLNLLDV